MRSALIGIPFVLAVLGQFGSLSADSRTHRAAAEELLRLTNVEKQLQVTIDQTLDLQIKSSPQLAPYRAVIRKFLVKHMSWEAIKQDTVTIYVDAFTERELNEIVAFYKTPTGKKMIEKSPELLSKGLRLGAERVQANQPELLRMLQEEMKKNTSEEEKNVR